MKNNKIRFIAIVVSLAWILIGCQGSLDIGDENQPISPNQNEPSQNEPSPVDTSPVEPAPLESEKSKIEIDYKSIEEKLDDIILEIKDIENEKEMNQILVTFDERVSFPFQYIFIANETGQFFINPTVTLPEDYDARERSWYIEAMKEGLYVSEFYQDAETGKALVTVAKKISVNGIDAGVIGIDVFFEE